MRGQDRQQSAMFSYISAEQRVPKDHPLRAIRAMADAALGQFGPCFDAIYASCPAEAGLDMVTIIAKQS